ncbi:MAG: helix-turn-helix domain-containing protein, partial [Candidatus Thorarchaeota archaeon]
MEIIDKNLKEFEIINEILDKKTIFSSEQLFKCILGLNKTESKVLCYLLKNQDVRTSDIALALEMDRSSIQRALQVLSMLKIIERSSMSMKEYTHVNALEDTNKQGY